MPWANEYDTYDARVGESDGGTGDPGGPSNMAHPPRSEQTKLSLDSDVHNSPEQRDEWGQKQRRAFHRLCSGIKRTEYLKQKCVHLVLTSSPSSDFKALNRHFESFRKRWLREFGKFEYCKVKTSEGFGVLHCIVRTKHYIPQSWISSTWKDIHGAFVVFIKQLYGSSQRAAGYLASQYCSKQRGFIRLSCSANWLGKGAIWSWKHICWVHRGNFRAILSAWDTYLAGSVTTQSDLSVEGIT